MKKWLSILLLITTICCESKDEIELHDYRDPYTGLFKFRIINSIVSMCYDTSELCINGWKEWNIDTGYFTSYIEKYDTNRLSLAFGDDTMYPYYEGTELIYLTQKINPVISRDGILSLQEFHAGSHNNFDGYFTGFDKITIKIQTGGLIGGYDNYDIEGILEESDDFSL